MSERGIEGLVIEGLSEHVGGIRLSTAATAIALAPPPPHVQQGMSTSNGVYVPSTALPTFKSSRDPPNRQSSYVESSNASSSRTRSQARSDGGSDIGKSTARQENAGPTTNGTVRRSKRSSGGFLLDSSPSSSYLSRSLLSGKGAKGKEKPDNGTITVHKTRGQLDGHDFHESTRGSPLSSEIRSSPLARDHAYQRGTSSQHGHSSLTSHGSASSRQNTSSYGFDSDPAQIVDMALRLNEARRRQASIRRNVSSTTQGRRIVSAATSIPARSSPPRQPSRQHGSLRQPTKRNPSDTEPVTPQKQTEDISEAADISPTLVRESRPEQNPDSPEDGMQISRATQNRVAKAKQYFELAYEHRRLLPHLPPLRRPDDKIDPEQPGYDSKAYNPLQYARNRKLRFRERNPIMAEEDGWHDIEKVRAWVDAIVKSHVETRHDPLECVRLPQLALSEEDKQNADNDSDPNPRRAAQAGKPRRPKSDWVTHPGDQIADAFWTEQGLNKQKIYNRDNELIYPPGTKFHFSGWRNKTPVKVPDALKHDPSSPEPSSSVKRGQAVAAPPTLPTFESANQDRWAKTRSKFTQALRKAPKMGKKDGDGIFDTSSESSDSSDSTEQTKEDRGRRRRRRHSKQRHKFDLPDGDPFAPAVRGSDHAETQSPHRAAISKERPARESIEHAILLKHLRRQSMSHSVHDEEAEKQKSSKRRNFLNSIKLDSDDRGRSSVEYDSTAPGTPASYGFPSIAINLSPPDSRDASPTRKVRSSIFSSAKDKIQSQKDHIERTDFAQQASSNESSKPGSLGRELDVSQYSSRGPSPMSRGTSPFTKHLDEPSVTDSASFPPEHRGSTASKVSSKTTDSKTTDSGIHRSHRVRGMFKGGRIAQLVGNEVSRVGDFIWKRDPPRGAATDEESISDHDSDSDEMEDYQDSSARTSGRSGRLRPNHSQVSEVSPSSAATKSSPNEAPQFHFQGLPSFTSPFQRDRDNKEKTTRDQSPGGTSQKAQAEEYDDDPVSTAARARRAAGKSPRLDRLAPPKLDIRSATPDGRHSSYGFGTALDLHRTRSASQVFNSAINNQPRSPTTGKRPSSAAYRHSSNNLRRSLSREDRSPAQPPSITMHDFFRTRALLLASAVKSTNISAYCDEIPLPQSAFLLSAFHATGAPSSEINKQLPARRREEHVIAARHLIEHQHKQSGEFNETLSMFTKTTTVNLHREIQILEDKVESSLFPRLQKLSDQAGQLAQKLTTTSTLAVKGVNDDVGDAMRMKRRGPYKLGRLLGYKLMEWAVVSVLWLIWFVVTVVRFGLGGMRALRAVLAWLCWLR